MDHALAERDAVEWDDLRDETILIQEWDDSQATRELYASLLGKSARFHPHPASKQSVFALVAAGFGVTLATASQAEVTVPGVVFRPIAETNASVQIDLVWRPATRGRRRWAVRRLPARRDPVTAPSLTAPATAAGVLQKRDPSP